MTIKNNCRNINTAPIIDAALQRGARAIINHKPQKATNAYFKCQKIPHTDEWIYKILANRNILNGEELCVDYRDAYGDFRKKYFPSFGSVCHWVTT